MKVYGIEPCICCDHEPNAGDSVYYGMPLLRMGPNSIDWVAFCPKCGRSGLIEERTSYLALKRWNYMQKHVKEIANGTLLFIEPSEEADGKCK